MFVEGAPCSKKEAGANAAQDRVRGTETGIFHRSRAPCGTARAPHRTEKKTTHAERAKIADAFARTKEKEREAKKRRKRSEREAKKKRKRGELVAKGKTRENPGPSSMRNFVARSQYGCYFVVVFVSICLFDFFLFCFVFDGFAVLYWAAKKKKTATGPGVWDLDHPSPSYAGRGRKIKRKLGYNKEAPGRRRTRDFVYIGRETGFQPRER